MGSRAMHHRGTLIALGTLGALAALAVGAGLVQGPARQLPDPPPDPASVPAGLPRRVAELLRGEARLAASAVESYESPIYVALRGHGRRLADGWFAGPGWQRPLLDGVAKLVRDKPSLAQDTDTLEVCIPHDYRELRWPRNK